MAVSATTLNTCSGIANGDRCTKTQRNYRSESFLAVSLLSLKLSSEG